MKKSSMLWLMLLSIIMGISFSHAQMPQGMAGGPVSQGSISGQIVDGNGSGVKGAALFLLQVEKDSATGKKKETLLKNTTTASNGNFSFTELPVRFPLLLKISANGFQELDTLIRFVRKGKAPSFQNNLGHLALMPNSDLSNVTVTAEVAKPALQMDIDKKVFNVEKNILSTGGTALDVLKNVPSVNVDIDGNVTMRNATPQIYVDGRPSTLTPDQIPSDAVESVEVMTNPSAKFDASGGNAGILNIVLKKNRKMGYNGSVRAGVDKYGGLNGGADLSLRQGKFNFTASGMINQNKGRTIGETQRNTDGEDYATSVLQNSKDRDKGGFMFGRLGLDYFMDDNTTFSLSGTKVHGSMKPYGSMDIELDTLQNGIILPGKSVYSQRLTNSSRTFNGNGLSAAMKHLYARQGQQWTADFNYFGGNMDGNSLYNTNYFDDADHGSVIGQSRQNMIGNGSMRFMTAQTDYVLPLGDKSKLEMGLRAQLSRTLTFNYNSLYDFGENVFDTVTSSITHYKSHNNVYAAYATYSSSIGDFGYQLGLRAERSDYDGTLYTTNQKYSNHYPVNLFPSLFLSQKLGKKQELQFNFSRRVNRPSFFQLIPFTDYSDSLNITRGNPDLVPEFTNKFELGYSKTFHGNDMFLASVYYSHTDHLLTRYLDTAYNDLSGTTDYINTYINASSSYSVGSELTVQYTATKWWSLNANVNIYKSKINTDNVGTSQDAFWSWYGKINNNITLPAAFSLQLSGNYQSKTNLPVNDNKGQMQGPPGMGAQSSSQGYIRPFWSVDAALRKDFFKDKSLSATLAFSDIFRSNKNRQYAFGDGFDQYYSRLRNPQMIRFTLSYRFGKVDMNIFKRKNMNQDNSLQGIQM